MAKKKKKEKKQKPLEQINQKETTMITACRWLIWAGLFLALLVPLMISLNIYFPFISYRSFWFMGTVQFIFAVWLFLAYHNQAYRPNLNLITVLMILFMVTLTISTIFGADPSTSFWSNYERLTGQLMHLHLFAFFLVLTFFLKKEADWQIVLSMAVGIAVLVTIWGLAANYNFQPVLSIFDATGLVTERIAEHSQRGSTLGNTSFMASYLLINAFFALYLLIKAAGRIKIPYALAFVIIILGIYLNPRGRAVQGSFLAGIAIIILLYLAFAHRHQLVRLFGKAVLSLGLITAPVIGVLAFIEGSFVRKLLMDIHGMPVRFATWESGLRALWDRPLFGWGLENFEIAFYHYYDPRVMLPREFGYPAQPWHDRAHNVVVDSLTATGIVGTIIFFGLFAAALFLLWRGYLKEDKYDFWAPAIMTALVAAHFIQNLTVFDMISSYMLIFLVLAFAANRAEPLKIFSGKKLNLDDLLEKSKIPSYAYSLALFTLLTLLFYFTYTNFVYKPQQAGIYINQAMQVPYQGSLTEIYPRALETSPVGLQRVRRDLAATATTRLQGASSQQAIEVHITEVEYMIEELDKAVTESPLNYRNFFSRGETSNAYGRELMALSLDDEMNTRAEEALLKAEEAYRQALEISPKGIHSYHGLAQNLIYQAFFFSKPDKYQESLDLLLEAREIEPRLFTTHHMALRLAADLIGDQALSMQLYEDALAVNPAWEDDLQQHLEDE